MDRRNGEKKPGDRLRHADCSQRGMHHKTHLRSLHQLVLGVLGAASLVSVPALADDRDEGVDSHESRRDNDSSKTHIAVDFDVNTAVSSAEANSGGGGQLRLGQELDLFLVSLTPELGGGYHSFAGDGGAADTRLYSGFLGGRLAVGKIIEPALFAHVGVAHTTGFEKRTAPLLDAGLAIDFTLLPLIDLGVHGGYNVMFPRDDGSSLKFVTLGAQAALVL
jgi:hypothetical protein